MGVREPVKTTDRVPRGIWGTVLLPIDTHGEIDWNALEEELAILCESGVHGLYTAGTAGEGHNLTDQEHDRLAEAVTRVAGGQGVPYQIGLGPIAPRMARLRLLRLRGSGASGVQVTLPDWWPPSLKDCEWYLEGLDEAAGGLPLILYNPPHAKRRLTLPEIGLLRGRAPSLVGAKLPGGDEAWYEERRRCLPGFSVFVPGHTVAFGRPLGANGSYSNVACLHPRLALHHWNLAGSDKAAAVELEARIRTVMEQHLLPLARQLHLSNAALDKLLAAAGDWGPVSHRLLWPYTSAPDEAVTELRAVIQRLLPEIL